MNLLLNKREKNMIGTCIQKSSSTVYLYDEKGKFITTIPGTLVSYTSNNCTIRPSGSKSTVRLYDDKGHFIQSLPA